MPLIEVLWLMRHRPVYNELWAYYASWVENHTGDDAAFKTMWLVKEIGDKVYGAPD